LNAKIVENSAYRDRTSVFRDRFEAGNVLADELKEYACNPDVIVLAVPAGGVPVGYVIAKEIAIPMGVIVVRKVQIPWSPEAGFGAVAWDNKVLLNENLVKQLQLTRQEVETAISAAKRNVEERLKKFRGDKPLPHLTGKIVVLVDDGLASGYTMLVAVRSVRDKAPKKIVVAVPTGSLGAIDLLVREVDEILCPNIRSGESFAVAEAYENWYDLTDEEVMELLPEWRKGVLD
jgi:putative phosphoribosyl transferase